MLIDPCNLLKALDSCQNDALLAWTKHSVCMEAHFEQAYQGFLWLTCMGLPSLSQIVRVCIVAPTLRGYRHLLSPRWLEEM